MARLGRLKVAGLPHLVLHEGHNGQALFCDDVDRVRFIAILSEVVRANGLALHAYSLAAPRVALLITPTTVDGFSRGMQSIAGRYAAAFNRRHGRTGALWNGRFRATIIEPETFLLGSIRYVETLAGAESAHDLAADGFSTPASSLSHHAIGRRDALIDDHPVYWALGNTPFEREAAYRAFIQDPREARKLLQIDQAVRKGWALGTEAFLSHLTQSTTRRVKALRPGRPRRD